MHEREILIAALAWAWFIGGTELLTSLHEVIGQVIFVGFYGAAAFAYFKIGRPRRALVWGDGYPRKKGNEARMNRRLTL